MSKKTGEKWGKIPRSENMKNTNLFISRPLVKEREATPEYSEKEVTLNFRKNKNQIEFEIEDQGQGFDYSDLPDPTTPEAILLPHGRGIMLIRSFMDHVTWNNKGNRITMMKKLVC